MAVGVDRRRSSWFASQFSINNLNLTSFNAMGSSRRSTSKPRTQPAPKLPMPEPLFHDAYLVSVEELSPTTPDPQLNSTWQTAYDGDYFCGPDETLEDFGLGMDDEGCSIVAKFISITYAGKPRVVDILPPSPTLREESPRRKAEVVARPPIVWRMPSYEGDSSARISQSSYTMSDRTESLCSTSTSISDECKTPDLISCDPSTFSDPQSRPSTPSRAKSFRRHSRNLSASFSKAFLNRLRDMEPIPPMPSEVPDVPPMPLQYLQPTTASNHPPSTAPPRTPTLGPPMSKHDMHIGTQQKPSPQKPPPQKPSSQRPASRRKKSLF